MALPVPNTNLAKKKKDPLDDLVDARVQAAPAKSGAVPGAGGATYAVDQQAQRDNVAAGQPLERKVGTARMQDPNVGLDELAAQRAAAAAELDADKAKALQGASARAGAGGFGLSGGTSAMLSDIGRQQDRNKILTMADFDKLAEDRRFTDIQRRAAEDEAEDAADFDYNGDGYIMGQKVGGKIGDRDPENDPKQKPQDEEEAKAAMEEAKASLATKDLYAGDPNSGPGSKEEPYLFGSMAELGKWFRDTTGMEPQFSSENYGGTLVIKDQFGNYYALTNQKNLGGGVYFG